MSISAIGSGLSYQSYSLNISKNGEERNEDKFAQLDADGDGGISLEESGLSEEEFAAMDLDGDQLLTELDRQAHLVQMMQNQEKMQPPDPSQLMAEMDADGDGYVTESELADHLAQMEQDGMAPPMSASELMAELDADGDGMVTQAELEEHLAGMEQSAQMMPPPPPPPPEEEEDGVDAGDLLAALDSDEDGELSAEEAGLSSEEFDALDTNEDGIISQAELEAAASGSGGMDDADSEQGGTLTSMAMSAYLSLTSTYLSNQGYQSVSLTA